MVTRTRNWEREFYEGSAWLALPVCLAVAAAWWLAAHIERAAARRKGIRHG